MNNTTKWISSRIRLGWIMFAAGVLVAGAGIFTELRFSHLVYNFRILTGLGILIGGIGIGYLVRYTAVLADPNSARRLTVDERDERTVLIRARAGNRAYWVSTALVYSGLMWASFAGNGDLPDLTGNVLWFFLAGAVLVPFGVYVVSLVVDQQKL